MDKARATVKGWVAAVGVCLGSGCYSGIPEHDGPSGTSSGGSDGGGSEDTGEGAGEPDGACEHDPLGTLGPSSMQRLTKLELDNVVRDLLGDDSRPASVLPDDDRVGPFTSNTIIDVPEHTVALYSEIAAGLAARAVEDLDGLVGCDPADGEPCARSFIAAFGRRAYRRPLTGEEIDRLAEVHAVGAESGFANGIRLVLEAMLQSPHFLYRVEQGLPTEVDGVVSLQGYELASRLSFFLWRSMPDDALLDAAEAGELDTPEGLRAQADRLLHDPRATEAIVAFHREWLELDGPEGIEVTSKDPALFPQYTPTLQAAMLAEQRAFVTDVFATDGSLHTLLTAHHTFANEELAALYGVEGVEGDALVRVELEPGERMGLLTQAGVLATQAGYGQTSPTRRGKLVRDAIMCETVPPPPPDVNDTLPPKEAGETKKEQLEAHVSDPACAGCHVMMDPIGFGFENFDPVGAFRTQDGEHPVDASGEVRSMDPSVAGPFDGPFELIERLVDSEMVARCVTRQWARFALGRDVPNQEATCAVAPAYEAFVDADLDLRELMIQIVMLDSFRHRKLPNPEGI